MDKPTLNITLVDSYTELGFNFQGNLAVVNYDEVTEYLQNKSPVGGFGQSSYSEARYLALTLVKQTFQDYQVLIEIPEIVIQYNPENNRNIAS